MVELLEYSKIELAGLGPEKVLKDVWNAGNLAG